VWLGSVLLQSEAQKQANRHFWLTIPTLDQTQSKPTRYHYYDYKFI